MSFWGVEVRPEAPFTLHYDESKPRLHISMASLGFGGAVEESRLHVNVGNKSPKFLCSLIPNQFESRQVNLEFEESEDLVFSVEGPTSIHLSGYYMITGHCRNLDENSESYGEEIGNRDAKGSEPADEDEDEYESDFINDDDPETFEPSADEDEHFKEKKLRRQKGKRLRKVCEISQSGDEGSSRAKKKNNNNSALARNDNGNNPISSCLKTQVSEKNGLQSGGEDEDHGVEQSNKNLKNDDNYDNKSKQYIDLVVSSQPMRPVHLLPSTEGHHIVEDVQLPNSDNIESIQANNVGRTENKFEENIKEMNEESCEKIQENEAANNLEMSLLPIEEKNISSMDNIEPTQASDDGRTESNFEENTKEMNEENCEKEPEKGVANNLEMLLLPIEEKNISSMDSNFPLSLIRTLENGLVIEVLKLGKPDGKVAVSGSKVYVRHVGKLKNTGEVIDSNIAGKKPFRFRLGSGMVIDGWEIGIEGMRVREKRRLTIPPTLGYGGEGNGRNIPPDSWLIYDVELVKVR